MRKKHMKATAFLLGSCVMIFSFSACGTAVRDGRSPNQNEITHQNRNLLGENLKGPGDPNAGPDDFGSLGTTPDINPGGNPPNTRMGITPSPPNYTVRQTPQQLGEFDSRKTEYILSQMGTIDGIQQFSGVVKGSTAVIGFTPSGTGKDMNATRDKIITRVKRLDNQIKDVVITDSPNMVPRIRQLQGNIKHNPASKDLSNEYTAILQGIGPTKY